MTHRGHPVSLSRTRAFATALVALVFVAVGGWVYWARLPQNLPRLELAGSAEKVRELLGPTGTAFYASALAWDLALIGCYVGALAAAGFLGSQVFVTATARSIARLTIAFGVLAGLAGLAANRMLAAALPRLDERVADGLAQGSQGFALTALVLLIVAVPAAGAAVGGTLWRLVRSVWPGRRPALQETDVVCGVTDDPITDSGRAGWVANWHLPEGADRGGVGICVSGGGIRSATFTLGAMEAMQAAGRLREARYLVAVSGGGYAAGALRLALQPVRGPTPDGSGDREADGTPPQPLTSLPTADDVFVTGSPEFDHLRRHSKYLADGPGQWLAALAVVLRGLLVVQVMLLLAVMLAARAVGELYAAVPTLQDALADPARLPLGVRWALAAPFLAALTLWVAGLVMENWPRSRRRSTLPRSVATVLALAGLVLVSFGLLVPLLVYASTWVRDQFPANTSGVQQAATGAATVLTTGYLAALAGIFLTVGKLAGTVVGWAQKSRAAIRVVPAVLLQRLLVTLGVLVLLATHLFVFARVVVGTTSSTHPNEWPGSAQGWHFWLMACVLLVLALLIDQTRWSLHPFYKKRLAAAFAVRRAREDGVPTAAPYNYDEVTDLHSHCSWQKDAGFPQVIFLTAANVSGQQVTPPGRKVLPYTMSGDWIGSPRLGWIRAQALPKAMPHPLRLDLTTQAAMAISGAAFASAMGASATPYSLLFTLTNARLGTWLPNPWFLHQHVTRARPADAWRYPRLPSWRRLQFLIREVFGAYPWDGQMLLLTDGGHYENLGLVELLRRAPSVVFCFDASGGASVNASALGPAISLAYEELGVKIRFDRLSPDPRDDPASLVPGSADPGAGQRADPVAARLARSSVLVATIEYPECRPPGAPAEGRLYLGRAGLTPDTPWEVRAYASRHSTFPNDSTGDQWFDQEQFDAYHALGRHVGEAVIAAAARTTSRAVS